jgi:hypothetical protein
LDSALFVADAVFAVALQYAMNAIQSRPETIAVGPGSKWYTSAAIRASTPRMAATAGAPVSTRPPSLKVMTRSVSGKRLQDFFS